MLLEQLRELFPWRCISSEEQVLEVKPRRSRSVADEPPDEWDLEIAGAVLRAQHLLENALSRRHAWCHLHSWVVYVQKFLSLCVHCVHKPSDMFRASKRRQLIV